MKITSTIPAVLLGLAPLSAAVSVSGSAEGFASGVTGGGDAEAQIPSDIDELKEWLTDDTPRVIVLDKEYDFTESEGTTSGTVCAFRRLSRMTAEILLLRKQLGTPLGRRG